MTEGLNPLGGDALTVKRARALGELVVMAAMAGLGVVVARRLAGVQIPWWGVGLAVAVGLAWVWWWTNLEHASWGWRLTDELLEVRRGVLVRRTHLVPRSRIQNVTTVAGPLQSRYGVVTLTVHTAGARTRNVAIEDLDAGHGEAIRRRLGLI